MKRMPPTDCRYDPLGTTPFRVVGGLPARRCGVLIPDLQARR